MSPPQTPGPLAGQLGLGRRQGRARGRGPGAPSGLRVCLPPRPPQKIMHTRKRHQDMFQDLSRRLQHADKDKEVLAPESKVCGGGALGGGGGAGGRGWDRGRGARRRERAVGKPALSCLPVTPLHSVHWSSLPLAARPVHAAPGGTGTRPGGATASQRGGQPCGGRPCPSLQAPPDPDPGGGRSPCAFWARLGLPPRLYLHGGSLLF